MKTKAPVNLMYKTFLCDIFTNKLHEKVQRTSGKKLLIGNNKFWQGTVTVYKKTSDTVE